ncbi:hypothetical protein Acid345_1200 [Candidatus Koribacter versatilis Ellin345]|uniref:Uncharacterized protein n=1 Tax=Koribacter versatilis (strain Ellin345) TaxID=204669 RepID=Q1ISE7_KORVE|nr:hypothetical protein [Candidatus Koribacter versatilis]ABF40203.1 hypothetical protein Acid345_1200 [Candidatus Koribacter versatilis Ellin345]
MKLVLATLLLGGLAFAQAANDNSDSVVAAAKKARETKTATAKKVYTDDDMPSSGGAVSTVGNPDAPTTTNTYNPSNDPVRDQKALDAEWRQRIRQQKDRVSSLEQQLRVADENVSRSSHYYTVNTNPNYAHFKQQADNLREQLANAKRDLTDLQDEAHKAGANKAYD